MSTANTRTPLSNFATKLEKLASDLEAGLTFSVTKLTPIKRLCADHALATRFAGHFADMAYQRFLKKGITELATAEQREEIRAAIECGIKSLHGFNSDPSQADSTKRLSSAYSLLTSSQDEYKKIHWNQVRTVYSNEALIIEKAIGCVLRPTQSPSLCYEMARDHAERYEPKFGTGLIPASAGAVRDISRFFRAEADRSS
jgi:hypothetical protein